MIEDRIRRPEALVVRDLDGQVVTQGAFHAFLAQQASLLARRELDHKHLEAAFRTGYHAAAKDRDAHAVGFDLGLCDEQWARHRRRLIQLQCPPVGLLAADAAVEVER